MAALYRRRCSECGCASHRDETFLVRDAKATNARKWICLTCIEALIAALRADGKEKAA